MRRNTTYNWESAFYKQTLEANCIILKTLFRNNNYLLKKNGITLYRQIKDLNEKGLSLDYGNIHRLKNGKVNVASLSYINFFCLYWGKSLVEMLSVDFEDQDQLLSEIS